MYRFIFLLVTVFFVVWVQGQTAGPVHGSAAVAGTGTTHGVGPHRDPSPLSAQGTTRTESLAEASAANDPDDTPQAPRPIRYTPRGDQDVYTKAARVVSSTRANQPGGLAQAKLYLLLPEEVALTTSAQPSLYWYLSQPVDHEINIDIVARTDEPKKLFAPVVLDGSKIHRGIQRLDLKKLAARLEPGVRYEWVVTIVVNPQKPAQNMFSSSSLWRIAPDEADEIIARIRAAKDPRQKADIAAEEGIWIDAMDALSELIDWQPHDVALRQVRADLLRQEDFKVDIQQAQGRGFEENIVLLVSGDNP